MCFFYTNVSLCCRVSWRKWCVRSVIRGVIWRLLQWQWWGICGRSSSKTTGKPQVFFTNFDHFHVTCNLQWHTSWKCLCWYCPVDFWKWMNSRCLSRKSIGLRWHAHEIWSCLSLSQRQTNPVRALGKPLPPPPPPAPVSPHRPGHSVYENVAIIDSRFQPGRQQCSYQYPPSLSQPHLGGASAFSPVSSPWRGPYT